MYKLKIKMDKETYNHLLRLKLKLQHLGGSGKENHRDCQQFLREQFKQLYMLKYETDDINEEAKTHYKDTPINRLLSQIMNNIKLDIPVYGYYGFHDRKNQYTGKKKHLNPTGYSQLTKKHAKTLFIFNDNFDYNPFHDSNEKEFEYSRMVDKTGGNACVRRPVKEDIGEKKFKSDFENVIGLATGKYLGKNNGYWVEENGTYKSYSNKNKVTDLSKTKSKKGREWTLEQRLNMDRDHIIRKVITRKYKQIVFSSSPEDNLKISYASFKNKVPKMVENKVNEILNNLSLQPIKPAGFNSQTKKIDFPKQS